MIMIMILVVVIIVIVILNIITLGGSRARAASGLPAQKTAKTFVVVVKH